MLTKVGVCRVALDAFKPIRGNLLLLVNSSTPVSTKFISHDVAIPKEYKPNHKWVRVRQTDPKITGPAWVDLEFVDDLLIIKSKMMQTNSSIELEPGSAVCRSDDTPGVVVKINEYGTSVKFIDEAGPRWVNRGTVRISNTFWLDKSGPSTTELLLAALQKLQ